MKYRGKGGTIPGKATNRASAQARIVEVESSQLRVGRVVPIGLQQKLLAEQGQFHAPHSTRRRAVRLDKTNGIHVVVEVDDEVAYEMVQTDVPVADKVVAIDPVPSATVDKEVTTSALTALSLHTDGEFPGGPIDQSVLTEYLDHVAYRLWQGDVYIFYV